MTSVELLERAAKVLRDHAEQATPGPWLHVDYASPHGQPMTKDGTESTYMGCGSVISMGDRVEGCDIAAPNGGLYPRGGYSPFEDMAYIALVGPPVALALADHLTSVAACVAQDCKIAEDIVIQAALAVARAILREEQT